MQTSTPMSAPPTPAPSHYTEVLSNTSGHPQALVAAHHRALDISEILDNILVQLPIKDLFVHQRVSKQFQAATKSPACQKKMFLKLSDTARETWRLVPSKKKRGKGRNRWRTRKANQVIHEHHKNVLREQDEHLNTLGQSIGRQRVLGISIGNELDEQNELLTDVESGVDRHQSTLDRARTRLGNVARKSKGNGSWITIAILIIVLMLLIIVLK